jgi:hypothetical protein
LVLALINWISIAVGINSLGLQQYFNGLFHAIACWLVVAGTTPTHTSGSQAEPQ